ncbi:MAG: response regulator [Myxococcales bacterium]|nr:response regulator [Myxococcales bacterium]
MAQAIAGSSGGLSQRRRRLFLPAALVLVISSGTWVVGQLFYGNLGVALFFAAVSALAIVLLRYRERLGLDRTGFLMTAMLLLVIAVGAFIGGGLAGTNACLFITIPVGALSMCERRGLWWVLPTLLCVGAMALLHHGGFAFPNLIPPEQRALDAALTWVTSLLVIAFLAWTYERAYQSASHELRAAREVAERAAAAKAEFAARVSHDVRTPLHSLLGLMEMMEVEDDSVTRKAQATQAQTTSRMLLHILDDLLDLSRAESGAIELRREPFSPARSVEQVLEVLSARAADRGNRLLGRVAPEVPAWVRGDAGRLQQVLLNLAGNAIKFTENGRVEIRVEREGTDAAGERLRFEVHDDGVGIEPAELAKVFLPYYQAGPEASRQQGAGLGLAISQRLVEAMGGRLQAESAPGRGSRFYFSLALPPLTRPPEPPPVVAAVESDLAGMGVLLAEDDETNRRLTVLMLERLGCRVMAVGDGKAAVEALQREAFDVVLIDIQMPVMDGVEATRRMRELVASGAIARLPPVVAMTAHTAYTDESLRERLGMAGVLVKPFQGADLHEVLLRFRPRGGAA